MLRLLIVNNEYLTIPEILEAIFAFLSRKDLYRSCTRVNHKWNAVSLRIIREKRKTEFIKIPGIRDNIIFHLYEIIRMFLNILTTFYVCKLWSFILTNLLE